MNERKGKKYSQWKHVFQSEADLSCWLLFSQSKIKWKSSIDPFYGGKSHNFKWGKSHNFLVSHAQSDSMHAFRLSSSTSRDLLTMDILEQPHLTSQVSTHVFQSAVSKIKIQQSRDSSYNATAQEFQNLPSQETNSTLISTRFWKHNASLAR